MTRRTSLLTWKNQSRPSRSRCNVPAAILGLLLLASCLVWILAAYQSFVSSSLASQDSCEAYQVDPHQGFIIFGEPAGQGAGNIMSGLLAVHVLGLEFDRIVCVHPGYSSFHAAFEATKYQVACTHLFACEKPLLSHAQTNELIRLINFHPPPNECLLQDVMSATTNHRILWIIANTYPRWTNTSPVRFTDYYQPKPALRQTIPWKDPPKQVVHLRAPDGTSDIRKGMDDVTLEALGQHLPSDTYLVTNRVVWYDWFEQRFHWSHPPWDGVVHSALALSWGDRRGNNIPRVIQDKDLEALRNLELWVDWYTILLAKSVIHTHSDFSSSAVHWMNIVDSHVLDFLNLNEGTLRLQPEEWTRHDSAAPLSRRKQDAELPERQQLQHCDSTLPLSGPNVV